MIRSSKHNIGNITNCGKINSLNNMFEDYKICLEHYISDILDESLPLKKNLSSKDLPTYNIKHSRYKQLIYKHASEIIRSQIDKANKLRFKKYKFIYKYFIENKPESKFTKLRFSELKLKNVIKSKFFKKPDLVNLSINLDERFFDIRQSNHFDNFIKIILPYFNEKETKALQIKIPLKLHKHSNKLKDKGFELRKNIQIKKVNNEYYINLIWFKEDIELKREGSSLGLDIGVNKLIVTSDNQHIGTQMKNVYESVCRKQRNSINFIKSLEQRTNLTNYYINQLNLTNVNKLIIEDLKNVKYKSSYNETIKNNKKHFNKKNQTKNNRINSLWIYPQVINKLERMCEEQGVMLVKVSPAYTSQTCSSCGYVDKLNRKGENFKCKSCGYELDADYNASINIHNRGEYSLSDKQKDKCLHLF